MLVCLLMTVSILQTCATTRTSWTVAAVGTEQQQEWKMYTWNTAIAYLACLRAHHETLWLLRTSVSAHSFQDMQYVYTAVLAGRPLAPSSTRATKQLDASSTCTYYATASSHGNSFEPLSLMEKAPLVFRYYVWNSNGQRRCACKQGRAEGRAGLTLWLPVCG